MKHLIASALIALPFALAGCSDDGSTSSETSTSETAGLNLATVSEAKQAAWPPGSIEDTDTLDSNLTRTNYMVVLDMSGSMSLDDCSGRYPSKAEAARVALSAWLEGVEREDNLGLVAFDHRGLNVAVPLGRSNRESFQAAVRHSSPHGGTPLHDAVRLAREQLTTRAEYQQGYGTYRLVVITDGQHNPGQDPTPQINAILDNPANPIEIHTIGFCIERSALNQPGRTVYSSAKNPEELAAGLESVLAESQSFDQIKEFQANDAQ